MPNVVINLLNFTVTIFTFTKYMLGSIPNNIMYITNLNEKKLKASLVLVLKTLPIILSSTITLYVFTKYRAIEFSMKNMTNRVLPTYREI